MLLLYWRPFTGSPLPRERSSHHLHGIQNLSFPFIITFYLYFQPFSIEILPSILTDLLGSKFPNSHVLIFSLPFTSWFLYWVYSTSSCSSCKPQLSNHLLYWAFPKISPSSTLYTFFNSTFISLFNQYLLDTELVIYNSIYNKVPPNLVA